MRIINDKLNNNRISLFFQEYYMYDNLSLKITFPQYGIVFDNIGLKDQSMILLKMVILKISV